MRFDQLNIPAFGPFSDFSLNFPASKYDVHLIYGANEAGKSSLLRAIRHLFFGIPIRTTDNFFHLNAKLLIGATISQEGGQLTFFRKKGTKNTLLDEGRNSLPDGALDSFLGAVNEEFFEHMFGLDTDSLRKGAAKLLSGEGDLGTAIFSASLGGSPIDDAIKSLEDEAGILAKGNSRKTSIALATAAFKEAERAAKAETTTANAWKSLKTEIAAGKEAFEEKDRLLMAHRTRSTFVENALRAIPVLGAISDLKEQLASLTGPELPADFPKRVREVEKELSESSQALRLREARIKLTRENLEKIPEFSSVLACAPDLGILHRRAEKYLEDFDSLPALQARVSSLKVNLAGEEDPEKYPAVRGANLALVRDAAATLGEMSSRSGEVARELGNLDIELKAQREQLAKLRTSTDLDDLEERCRRLDSFAAEYQLLDGLEERAELLQGEQNQLLQLLALEGDPVAMKVAGPKVIQEQEQQRLVILEKIREIENRSADVRDALSEEKASLSHLVSQGEIYTLSDLGKSRGERDILWKKILESEKVEVGLGEAIDLADTIADALRDDADHLAKAAGHQAKIAILEAKKSDLQSDFDQWEEKLSDWRIAWQSQYAVVPGQSPAELLEWRQDWEKVCEVIRELSKVDLQISSIREREASLMKELDGMDFSQIHRATKSALNKANQERGEWSAIEKLVLKNEVRREQLMDESESLAGKLKKAQEVWRAAGQASGLSDEVSPAAAVETLTERNRFREEILKFCELKQALEAKRKSVEDYTGLLETTAGALKATPSEALLHRLHEDAVVHQDRAETLRSQLAEFEKDLPALRLANESHLARRAMLREQAGSMDLESVMLELEKRQALLTRLEEQGMTLGNLAAGRSVAEFVAELEKAEMVALTEEKASLANQERHLQGERDTAKGTYDGHLRRLHELMKASDLAAGYQQAAADALSTIVAESERFRQLHYAIDFLKQQVEAYRQKTQGPMIGKTSNFFQRLTGGAFEKVAAQLDEKGGGRLIALRAGGESVETTGLSEGTADQLYLALRLAAIDLHLENHPAIPLILDDLLMTFDDERTRALLPVLQELSRKTQILIFTHHSHLKDLVGSGVLVHELRDDL